MTMGAARSKDMTMKWDSVIGIGVAGNVTGHLEQAREADDFLRVAVSDPSAPKGVFPFYVPKATGADGRAHQLGCMPISSTCIRLASLSENHQIEPEMALLCDLSYRGRLVSQIVPRWAMAHNDCSIRRPGALKISEKKNWGADSKGTSTRWIAVDRFAPGGTLDTYRLASFMVRDGCVHPYGIDSAVSGYSYWYQQLIDWLIERLNTQEDEGPLEDMAAWLACAGYPEQALISVGATRYTEFGEHVFLRPGDRSVVVLYDRNHLKPEQLIPKILDDSLCEQESVSVLDQRVLAPR